MTESFYEVLGVPTDADTEEIERAYRQRIKETHPDVNDDPDASEDTARLVEARDVLTDEDERARYDRLGHEAYLADEASPGSPDSDPASSRAAADAASSGSANSGPTNARASAEERRRRERRAAQDVDFGADVGGPTATGSTAGGTGGTNGASVGPSAGAAAGGGPGDGTEAGNDVPPSWSDTSDGWAARAPTSAPPGLATQVVESVMEAPATAIVIFLLYPLLVFGAFLPAFPLIVNVIVGGCLLAMIGAVQSVAGLGVLVYGVWSVVGTLGLIVVGMDPLTPFGLVILGTTWLPLGFSFLTYRVVES